jgi:hypothetical protein
LEIPVTLQYIVPEPNAVLLCPVVWFASAK